MTDAHGIRGMPPLPSPASSTTSASGAGGAGGFTPLDVFQAAFTVGGLRVGGADPGMMEQGGWLSPLPSPAASPAPSADGLLRATSSVSSLTGAPAVGGDVEHAVAPSSDAGDAHRVSSWTRNIVKHVHGLTLHSDTVLSVVVDRKRGWLVSGSQDHDIRVWSLSSYLCLGVLEGHSRSVLSLVLQQEEPGLLFSSSHDNTVRVWQLRAEDAGRVRGQCVCVLAGFKSVPMCMALDGSGRLFVGCQDTTLLALRLHGLASWGSPSDASPSATARRVDIHAPSNAQIAHHQPSSGNSLAPAFSSASYRDDEGCVASHAYSGHVGYVYCVCTSRDHRFIFSGSGDGTVRVWSKQVRLHTIDDYDDNADCDDDEDALDCIQVLEGHDNGVTCLAVSSEGYLFSGSKDGTVKVWLMSGSEDVFRCVRTLEAKRTPSDAANASAGCVTVLSLRCVDDFLFASCVCTVEQDRDVVRFGLWKMWDLNSYRCLFEHFPTVPALPYLSDAESVGSEHRSLVFMDMDTDFRHLYIASSDATVHVWRLNLNAAVVTATAHDLAGASAGTGAAGSQHVPPSHHHNTLRPSLSTSSIASRWSVAQWLTQLDLEAYISTFEEEEIDWHSMSLLTDADLKSIGLPLGPRRKLLAAMAGHSSTVMSSSSFLNLDEQLVEALRKFVAIPSVSQIDIPYYRGECWRAAKFLQSIMEDEVGMETRLLQARPGKNPIVLGRIGGEDVAAPRVVIYTHYDVVSVRASKWQSPPFQVTGRNGFLYGRGVTDNKGPMLAMMYAIKELGADLPVQVVIVAEGEEESDSKAGGFQEAVLANMDWLGNADVVVIANSYWLGDTKPCLIYGMRGVINAKVSVLGARRDLHSGVHGGCCHEPMSELVRLLASLVDNDGNITISGFDADVLPVTEEEERHYSDLEFDVEQYKQQLGVQGLRSGDCVKDVLMCRWRQPSLTIGNVLSSSSSNTVISKLAVAHVSMRTVPNQNPDRVFEVFADHLQQAFAAIETPNELSVTLCNSGEWWLGDPRSREYQAAEQAIEHVWKRKPLYTREGGTMPTTRFLEEVLNANAIHIPFGQQSDQAHLEDERIRLLNLIRGREVFKEFLTNLAESARKEE